MIILHLPRGRIVVIGSRFIKNCEIVSWQNTHAEEAQVQILPLMHGNLSFKFHNIVYLSYFNGAIQSACIRVVASGREASSRVIQCRTWAD